MNIVVAWFNLEIIVPPRVISLTSSVKHANLQNKRSGIQSRRNLFVSTIKKEHLVQTSLILINEFLALNTCPPHLAALLILSAKKIEVSNWLVIRSSWIMLPTLYFIKLHWFRSWLKPKAIEIVFCPHSRSEGTTDCNSLVFQRNRKLSMGW